MFGRKKALWKQVIDSGYMSAEKVHRLRTLEANFNWCFENNRVMPEEWLKEREELIKEWHSAKEKMDMSVDVGYGRRLVAEVEKKERNV